MSGRLTQRAAAREALDQARLALAGLRLEAALTAVHKAGRADPQDKSFRLIEAQVHLERGEPQEVLRSLDAAEAYGQEPMDVPMVWWLRAQALMRLERYGPASAALRRLLELAPMDALAWRALRSASEAMQDRTQAQRAEEALQRMESASRHTSADEEVERLHTAQRMVKTQRYADAAESLAPLMHDADDEPAVLLQAVAVAEASGDQRRLAHACARLGTLERGDASASVAWWLKSASALWMQGKLRDAVIHAWQATREKRDDASAWSVLMLALRELGHAESALRADRRLRRLTDRATRRQLIAQCWPMLAIARLVVSTRVASDDVHADAMINVGPTLLDELLNETRRTLDGYTQRWPHRADAMLHRGVVADAMGDTHEAQQSMQQALELNPQYDKARHALTALIAA